MFHYVAEENDLSRHVLSYKLIMCAMQLALFPEPVIYNNHTYSYCAIKALSTESKWFWSLCFSFITHR